MHRFFSELKRRHVDRVAIAYAVAAWLIAQVVALVGQAFEFPAWVMRATILALILGFVVAVIVSWAYELTAQGLTRDIDVAGDAAASRLSGRKLDFAIIALLIVALGLALATRNRQPESVAPEKSIAVLAFANMSGDEHKEYLSEGIADTLIH